MVRQLSIDYSITTIARPTDYIHTLLTRLEMETTVRLIVGSPDSEYLAQYRDNPSIEIVETSPHEWERIQNFGTHHRAMWNYWRTLSLVPLNPGRDGLVIFEDDVLPARGWQYRLHETLNQVMSRFGRDFVLALYCPYNLAPDD